ncbi:MAG: hypothetical protein Fur0043_18040 [Anaerolineales bacterium]
MSHNCRLLLAPAGHGKTEYLIQHIRHMLVDEPLAPVLVIVPNSIQAKNFRKRLSAAGGALGVEVHTFHTLYAELLTRAGQPIPLLPDPVRIRLLRFLVDDLCKRGTPPQVEGIRYYAVLRDKPGFIAGLRDTIEELKRARIFPADFSAAVKGLGARLEEIALLYTAYQDWLQKQGWADNEGRGWLAAIALESTPTLGADTRLLVVSGFDEFNPTQLVVLSLLAGRAQETLITLTGDLQNPGRPAHHRFRRAQAALVNSLNLQPEAMDSASMLSAGIARVEAGLFEMPQTFEVSDTSEGWVEFIEAPTRAVEARAALRWAKARILHDGMNLNEVAILARDLEAYRPFLEEVAFEFGIPLRIIGGQPLRLNPAVAAFLTLLSLPAEEWKRRALVETWHSPYFDFSALGMTSESAATLDEISRAGRVIQGLEQWREAFELWEKKKTLTDEEGDALPTRKYDEQVREKFDSFVDLLTPPDHASMREYVAFVETLIGEDPANLDTLRYSTDVFSRGLNVVGCVRKNNFMKERDIAALCAFKDVLRGLVLAESVLGADTLSYVDFYTNLRGAVEATTFSIPAESGVFVASVLDGRGLSFEAVALLGLSEGDFPKQEREDIFLREADRAILRQRGLSLETKLHGDEATFFYQAVTRGRRRLLLTRPYLAEDGQAWEASPFWDEMVRLNGEQARVRVRGVFGEVDPAGAASYVEWVEAARAFDIHIQNGIEALRARMSPQAEGKYEGELFDLSGRFGAEHGWSASRLESYGTCPFEFFVAYVLGLEPRQEAEEGFDVRMLGSMLHKILEEVYATGESLKHLPDVARRVFDAAPQEYGFRPTALWTLQQQEFVRMLEKTIRVLDEVSQGYTPKHVEARFGMGNPSLILKTSAGEVRLHGYIDRLDAAPDGSLRVIDYKAGGTAITAKHLMEGRRLQLPIYALAARDALGLGQVSGGFYWHIQKAEASSLKLEQFEGGVEAAFETAVKHIGNHITGIRAGRFEPKPPQEGCPSYCPAVRFCWRYKRGF